MSIAMELTCCLIVCGVWVLYACGWQLAEEKATAVRKWKEDVRMQKEAEEKARLEAMRQAHIAKVKAEGSIPLPSFPFHPSRGYHAHTTTFCLLLVVYSCVMTR
jgi:hypothetical protein